MKKLLFTIVSIFVLQISHAQSIAGGGSISCTRGLGLSSFCCLPANMNACCSNATVILKVEDGSLVAELDLNTYNGEVNNLFESKSELVLDEIDNTGIEINLPTDVSELLKEEKHIIMKGKYRISKSENIGKIYF